MRIPIVIALLAAPLLGGAAHAATCEMRFDMKGWAAFYQKSDGSGVVTCSNGQTAAVRLSGRGGGIAAGKWRVTDGVGRFSGVTDIRDVFGDYAATNAGAGMGPRAGAQAMTKGPVSLSLKGTGKGVDLSAGFGRMRIERR